MERSQVLQSEAAPVEHTRLLGVVREQLAAATTATKCHSCGCLHSTVSALEAAGDGADQLAEAFARAKATFATKKYDCLGCSVCFPAIAANAYAEAFPENAGGLDLCPTEAPAARAGWPPLPGDFEVVRYQASVAVCTLNSRELLDAVSTRRPSGLSLVGTMHTENLGIERVIKNVLANLNIRFLVVCGEDAQQAIGHLPGQSLLALARSGVDASGRIVGARGKRPVLKNVTADEVRAFLRQVEVVDLVGETDVGRVISAVEQAGARAPGPVDASVPAVTFPVFSVPEPSRLALDPAGFFVVYPDPVRRRLVVEHYVKDGSLDAVLAGQTPAALYTATAERGLVTRLDHAAYLGHELARAARSLETGEPFVQDRAAGVADDEQPPVACGCSGSCGSAP